MGAKHDNPLKPLELLFKRFALGVGRTFFRRRGAVEAPDLESVRSILFLRYDKLGDMIVTLPVFETVKRLYPHIRIGVVASPANQIIIRHDPRVDQVFVYNKHPLAIPGLIRAVRREKYDVVVAMISLRSATSLFMAQLLGKNSYRVGLGQEAYAEYYHTVIPVPLDVREHMLEQSLKALSALGISRERCVSVAPLALPRSSAELAGAFLPETGTAIGVNISAGKPNRIWAQEKFSSVLRELASRYPEKELIILCAPDDREKAKSIGRASEAPFRVVPPGLSILDVAAIIQRLGLIITPDTSIPHIARSFEIPVVGLYSRDMRNTASWRPYGQKSGVVLAQSTANIYDITPDMVLNEVETVLSEHEQIRV